jgi:hypothetical protein
VALILVLLAAACLSAEEWKTEDGNISVEAPDPSRFTKFENVGPMSVFWITKDEKVKLAVIEQPFPSNVELVKSGLEEGLVEEVGGKIVASSAEDLNGHRVFLLTAQTNLLGRDAYLTEAVVKIGGKAYKVMATGLGTHTGKDPDVTKFISSLKILAPAAKVATSPRRAQQSRPESYGDWVSKKIGGIGVMLLILGILAKIAYRRGRGTRPPGDESEEGYRP